MEKRVTRRQIAELTGTSVSTVSRALNRSGYVNEEKRKEILKVAGELNYIPNPVAMSLQESRTRQIIFFCNDLRNPYNIQMYQGMLPVAKKHGYRVLLDGIVSFENIKNTMTDGIIVPNEMTARMYIDNYGKNYNIPLVCASYNDGISVSRSLTMVEVDMYRAMEMGLEYLRKCGHKTIAYATPFTGDSSRETAYISWMREKGFDYGKYIIKTPYDGASDRIGEFDFRRLGKMAAYEYVKRYCKTENIPMSVNTPMSVNIPTAVIGFNDDYAYGIIDGFLELGFNIPGDVSVMGIDGIYTRQYMRPTLTTIALFPEKHGAACMETVISMIEGERHKFIARIRPKLIKGETVLSITC